MHSNPFARLIATSLFTLAMQSSIAAPVKVAVSANVQYAYAELAETCRQTTGVSSDASFASSGKLATQILNGAPFELFLSADNETPAKLAAAGFTLRAPVTYAVGALVLWSTDPGFDPAHWPQWLARQQGKVAIANPQTAPYGAEALRTLAFHRLRDNIQPRLVIGDNVGQAAQFVDTGAAQAGFIAKALVVAPQMRGKGRWVDIPASQHQPILQDMALLKPAASNPDADKLMQCLQSTAARRILQRYGYRLP